MREFLYVILICQMEMPVWMRYSGSDYYDCDNYFDCAYVRDTLFNDMVCRRLFALEKANGFFPGGY